MLDLGVRTGPKVGLVPCVLRFLWPTRPSPKFTQINRTLQDPPHDRIRVPALSLTRAIQTAKTFGLQEIHM